MPGNSRGQDVRIPDAEDTNDAVLEKLHPAVRIDVHLAKSDRENAGVFVGEGGGDESEQATGLFRRGFAEVLDQGLDAAMDGFMVWVRGDTLLVKG